MAAGGLLAGCSDIVGQSDGSGGDGTETPAGGSYTVSMAPMGEVSVESVPETWVANNGSWADMGIALGLEPPKGVWKTSRYHTQYYDGIDGVSVDKSGMRSLFESGNGVSKELLIDLDADVHVIDPNFLLNRFKGWDRADVDEIADTVGPFFGNSIFSTGYPWHEDYPYYSLYEAFGRLAELFQRTDRYDAFRSLHREFQSTVETVVAAQDERPRVAIAWATGDQPEEFSPYLIGDGTSFKQWRDLQVRDAFAETDVRDFHSNRNKVDYEMLVEIDPDVLLLRGQETKTASEFRNTVVAAMENHGVASELTAVRNGDVYRGGGLYQGPITNLVLTERGARQIYGVERELFDRDRVADIVAGDV
jgi:iron complex transport system substrate-binding protein